jgi:hypothetical protein
MFGWSPASDMSQVVFHTSMKSYLGTKGGSRKTVKFLGRVEQLMIQKTELTENSPVIDALQDIEICVF